MPITPKYSATVDQSAPNKIKILIAEDSNSDRLILQRFLTSLNYEVLEACDGAVAVELYLQHRPGIVLLDVLMPRMDGFEVAKTIKELDREAFVPIIFLTSLKETSTLVRCLEAGGDDFLVKPYNRVVLEAKLKAFVRMREMHLTVQLQRDEIVSHHNRLVREQEIAKQVFDKVAHVGCLEASNIQYMLSPIAFFNGDVALAGVAPSGNLMVLLGDFTGHGLDAAIGAMPLAQTFYTMLGKGFSQVDILRELNRILYSILPVDVFCCALITEIDFKAGVLQVWNGGLPDGLIYRPRSGQKTHLQSSHLPLGIRSSRDFDADLESYEFEPGDRLYIWSDGIHEAENEAGQMFGEQRLLEVFDQNTDPAQLFHDINQAVQSFVVGGELGDDISLIEVTLVEMEAFTNELSEINGDQRLGPSHWSFNYQLQAEALKSYDPLPMLLQVLMEVPLLRRFSGQIFTILTELYSNAVEHGVLGLESNLKQSPSGFSEYYNQRKRRLDQLTEGHVKIALAYQGTLLGGRLTIEVTDSGAGFNYQPQLVVLDQNSYAGRGIQLLKSLCESIEYKGCGNCVEAVFQWGDKPVALN